MKSREAQEKIVENLKRWQKIENASVVSTGEMIARTDHPLLRTVMEIIQRDSQMHYHLQQLIIDSMETRPITLTPEDVAGIWDGIEKHIEIEKKTIEMAEEILGQMKGGHMTSQVYLLRYLLQDEEKHNAMLEALEQVKKNMYPYA